MSKICAMTTLLALAACGAKETDPGRISRDPSGIPRADGGSLDRDGLARTGNESGTRLKVRAYVGDDGSKLVIPGAMHDTELKADCGFAVAADGATRCLPTGGTSPPSYFLNAGCTEHFALVPKGCAKPAYVQEAITGAACAAGSVRVRSLAGAFTGAQVFAGIPGTCTAQPGTVFSSYSDIYSLGAEVPPSSFVKATEQLL